MNLTVLGSEKNLLETQTAELEDEFENFYNINEFSDGLQLIAPPYNFNKLPFLRMNNNTLNSCIDAMKTNVFGTGGTIVPKKKAKK